MKVLQVIPSLSPVHGGPSVALPVMERALTAAGVTVETATTNDDGRGRRLERTLGQPVAENHVTRWYFRKQTDFYKVSLPLLRWLDLHVERFDVVHVHALFSFASLAAAWVARRHHVPYVVRPLGVLNEYGMTRRRAWLKQCSFRWGERPLLQDAAAVHFTSAAEQVEAERLRVPMKAVVIPLGIEEVAAGDGERFLQDYPQLRSRRRLLFLSRIDPKKNLEGLFQALGSLVRQMPVSLVVCGDGDPRYVAQLRAHVQRLQLDEHVTWMGRVEGRRKADVFAASDVFILPSYSENFGIAGIEALAAGLPCVLGEGVAVATEIEAAGAGVTTGTSAASIEQGLRTILQNDSVRQRAAREARQLASQRYSARQMALDLVELYRRIGRSGTTEEHLLATTSEPST